MIGAVVLFLGGCILCFTAAMHGLVIHRWVVEVWPALDRVLPKDSGAILGLTALLAWVLLWVP
jgi:hypothetical protein